MNGGGGTHFRGRMIARSNGLATGQDKSETTPKDVRGPEVEKLCRAFMDTSQMAPSPSRGLDPVPITFPLTYRPRCPLSPSPRRSSGGRAEDAHARCQESKSTNRTHAAAGLDSWLSAFKIWEKLLLYSDDYD